MRYMLVTDICIYTAHVQAIGATLVSNNTREFERVPGLRVENWAVET
jgi:tRNA(fMet)-specific endonuclease VapC